MKRPAIFIVLWITASSAVQAQSPDSLPTPFEAFAIDPGNETIVTKTNAGFVSADASIAIDLLLARDLGKPGQTMRGLRISLSNNSGYDEVYVEQHEVSGLLRDLERLQVGIKRLEQESLTPYRVQGTENCWMREPPTRVLCPSYRVGPDWRGLLLSAYGSRQFAFPNREPAELRERIAELLSEHHLLGP